MPDTRQATIPKSATSSSRTRVGGRRRFKFSPGMRLRVWFKHGVEDIEELAALGHDRVAAFLSKR